MTSRRNFLSSLPLMSAAAASVMPLAVADVPSINSSVSGVTIRIPIESGWLFRRDPSASQDPGSVMDDATDWQKVTVPHTWQALGGWPDYVGVGWYRTNIETPRDWEARFVRIEFEAVFHTAHVYLNGAPIGEHVGKGYTAFTCDLSPALRYGQSNVLTVRVDNTPSDTMLPRLKSYDWANDGGLTRPVSLVLTPLVFAERIEIDAMPSPGKNTAEINIRAIVRNTLSKPQPVHIHALVRVDGSTVNQQTSEESVSTIDAGATAVVSLPAIHMDAPLLWHFDNPQLYVATVAVGSGAIFHQLDDTFGIRHFEVRGTRFYLNGEPVRLMGVERMAGSHPEFGMAETSAWIESNHRDMQELNCVFTRVHWPQDRRVLDFCDRNGILIQEEVPAWGPMTFRDTSDEVQRQLEQNGLEQLREMVARDRNHPSVVVWGLCNEVDGKNPRTLAFAKAISSEARRIDPVRLQTYASNSLADHPEKDMAGEFDFISTNEYYGSWHPGGPDDVRKHVDRIRKAFPGKPIVVSEYGWCECQASIPPGDQNRVEIIEKHTEVFRDFPEVAGAIYFDYNDYRTLVGDKGLGSFKQRVHGVVDLYGNRKPSFAALRRQSSPIESLTLTASDAEYALRLATRQTLPAYPLRGYRIRWAVFGYDGLSMNGRLDLLRDLKPGETLELKASFREAGIVRVVVDVMRPTGSSVATVEIRHA